MSTMFDHFDSEARRAMLLAVREARRCECDFLGTDHVLFGLLCDSNGAVAQVLRALDTVPETVSRRVHAQLLDNDDFSADVKQLPLSPAVRRVFAHARRESLQLGQTLIGTEHLLLGLLQENTSNAGHLLGGIGIRLAGAQGELQKLSPADRLQHLLHPGEKAIAGAGAMGEPAPTPKALENLLAAPAMATDAEATALRAGHPTANAQHKQKLPANTRLGLGILLAGAPTRFSDITMAGWLFFLSNTAILIVCAFLMLPWTDPHLPAPLEVARDFLILGEVVYLVLGWGICKALDIRFLRRVPVVPPAPDTPAPRR